MNQKPKVYVQLKTDPFQIIGRITESHGKLVKVLWPQEKRARLHLAARLVRVGGK